MEKIMVEGYSSQVHIHATNFYSNTASVKGDDVFIFDGMVTVQETCPPIDWTGNPSPSSNLDIYNYLGTLGSDTTNSYTGGTCQFCSPGQTVPLAAPSFSSSTCQICEAGKFSQGKGWHDCFECALGKFAAAGAAKYTNKHKHKTCSYCAAGTFTDYRGAVVCTFCSGGQYSGVDGASACSNCDRGKFSNPGATSCETCEHTEGFVAKGEGNNNCEYCGIGKYANLLTHECKPCVLGKYSVGGVNECLDCESGKFNLNDGASSCSPEGQYSSSVGAATCSTAPAGKKPTSNRQGTENCPPGTFSAGGKTECVQYESGKFSSEGAVGCSQCEPGEVPVATLVKNARWYTSTDQTECLLCPAGRISGVSASSCTVCEEGKYAENEGNTECKFCDDDEMLVGSTTLQNGTTSANGCICPTGEYVQFSENTCQKEPEGVETTIDAMTVKTLNVKEGYWRTNASSFEVLPCLSPEHCLGGPNPAYQCKEGHTGPLCAVCQDGFASTGSGMFFKCSTCEGGDATTTIAIGFGAFLTCCCIRKKKKKGREGNDDDDDRTGLSSNDSLAANTNRVNKKLSKIDSILPFYTNARPYGKSCSLTVEFFNMMPLGCVINRNFHHALMVYTLVRFLTGVAMMTAYVILKRLRKVEASNTVYGWFLFTTFLILPSVSTKLFSTFACRISDGSYGSYLKVDYSINCASDEHKFYEAYAVIFIIIYMIGVPALCAWNLWKDRHLLDPGQEQLADIHGEELGMKMAIEERERLEEEHLDIKSLAFLYDSYEPQYYWFEVVETLKKLILTGGLVVLGPGTLNQIVISMIICLGSMRVFSGCEPYINYDVDVFSEMAQWQIFFVMLVALLLGFSGISQGDYKIMDEDVFDMILLLTQGLAPAVFVIIILIKGKDAADVLVRKVTKSMSGDKGGEESGEESGLELAEVNRGVVLGVELGGLEVKSPFAEEQ
ncbi:hypothetical protein TL16_g00828 [Triparma laevis f. inornata]|uniref:Tyrosine-protein kinase ephrin type A/B receptor-like domain-containing protein n=1 Tax=Triparma laevis f. inornata TaxID=1714386 RepID=A0A9W7DQ77_9STRA|nr:hypothetical protein TL16_g00828 [Triparma laevis f. inornata]